MSISTKLILAKQRCGFTSAVLAQRAGVPVSTVNKILSGQTRRPSPQALERLCRVLGISLPYLLNDNIGDERFIAALGGYIPAYRFEGVHRENVLAGLYGITRVIQENLPADGETPPEIMKFM